MSRNANHRSCRWTPTVVQTFVSSLTLWIRAAVLLYLTCYTRIASADYESFSSSYLSEMRSASECYINGDYSKAVTHYRAAIQAAPQSLDASLGCLLPLLALARFEEAESLATQVLNQYPSNYYASLRLSYALRMQGKRAKAEVVLNRMREYYPTDVFLLLELALVKFASKQNTTAKRLFLEVLTLAPDNVIALQHLDSLRILSELQDDKIRQSWQPSLGVFGPEEAGNIRLEAAIVCAYQNYHGTESKDDSYLAGVYAALGYGMEHLLEAETDTIRKSYRGQPALSQHDITVAYANFGIPHLKLRLGGHFVDSEDRYTDRGWVAFGGAEYYVANRWAAGLDGYFSKYPKFQDDLEVVQLTPHVGVTFGQGPHSVWSNDLRGYWIHLNRDVDTLGNDFGSVEDRLSFGWRRWTFSIFGWVGKQIFAVRNDGFALYNMGEEHKAGYGADIAYAFSERYALKLRASREEFRDIATAPNASSDMYLAMLSVRF